MIRFLGLEAVRDTQVRELPYGLQKRVELTRALVTEPDLLSLDEPMAGMNREETIEMGRFVLGVRKNWGTTVLLIEHDMNMVMRLSDHVVVLSFGLPISQGTPDEVLTEANVAAVYGADVVIARHPQTGAPVVLPRGVEKRPSGPCVFGTRSDER